VANLELFFANIGKIVRESIRYFCKRIIKSGVKGVIEVISLQAGLGVKPIVLPSISRLKHKADYRL
jgi:hypothetical protein